MLWPVHGFKDPRTKHRLFSYTLLELLIARDLGRPERNPNGECRMPNQAIRHLSFRIRHCPVSLGTLFKGRDEFLAELRQHLTAESTGAITGKRTIHGMGGVGKTHAAIEYAWKHADDYRALLFISADTPEALHRNLAALCGPLVLNLPEQNEKEQALQV